MNGLMSHFRMCTILASIDFPIDQKTTAHPGTQCEIEESFCRNPSPTVLAERGYVGIYIHVEWATPLFFHDRFERDVPPGGLMQGRNDSLFPIQWSAYRCSHAHDLIFFSHF